MSSTKPFKVRMTEETHDQIARFADAWGRPKGTVISDALKLAMPEINLEWVVNCTSTSTTASTQEIGETDPELAKRARDLMAKRMEWLTEVDELVRDARVAKRTEGKDQESSPKTKRSKGKPKKE